MGLCGVVFLGVNGDGLSRFIPRDVKLYYCWCHKVEDQESSD